MKRLAELIKRLEDPKWEERWLAAKELEKIGWKPANKKEEIIYLLAKGEWKEIIKTGQEAVDILIKSLKETTDTDLELKIIEVLGELRDKRAIDVLKKYIPNNWEYIERKAVEALEKIGWKPANKKEEIIYLLAKEELEEIAKIGKQAISVLVEIMNKENPEEIDPFSFEEPRVIYNVLYTLDKIKSQKAIDYLIKALYYDDVCRDIAFEALTRRGKKAERKLIKALKKDLKAKYYYISETSAIIDLLIQIRSKKALRTISSALGKLHEIAKESAILYLLISRRKKYIIKGIKELKRINWYDTRIFWEIFDIEGIQVIKPFSLILKKGDSYDRRIAARELKEMGWTPKKGREEAYFYIETGIWERIDENMKSAIKPIKEYIEDEYVEDKQKAIEALARIKSKKAENLLINMLEKQESHQLCIIWALGEKKSKKAIELLLKMLKNEEEIYTLKNLEEAIVKIGGKKTEKKLKIILEKKVSEDKKAIIERILNELEKKKEKKKIFPGRKRRKEKKTWREKIKNRELSFIEKRDALLKIKERISKNDEKILIEILKNKEEQDLFIRREIIYALGSKKSRGIRKILREIIEKKEYPIDEKISAIESLEKNLNKKTNKKLKKIYDKNEERCIKEKILEAWENKKTREIKKQLVKILMNNKEEEYLRRKAAEMLEKIKWKPKNEGERAVLLIRLRRWEHIELIGKKASDALIEALNIEDIEVRGYAIRILGNLKEKRATIELVKRLKKEEGWNKISIIEALGKINDKKTIDFQIKALEEIIVKKEESRWVKEEAVEVLEKMGWKPGNKKEELAVYLAKKEWKKVEKIAKEFEEELIELQEIESHNMTIRKELWKILKKIKSKKIEKILLKELEKVEEKEEEKKKELEELGILEETEEKQEKINWAKIIVIEGMGIVGGIKSSEKLREMLKEIVREEKKKKELTKTLIRALGEIKDEKAIPLLIRIMKEDKIGMKIEAKKALREIGKGRELTKFI